MCFYLSLYPKNLIGLAQVRNFSRRRLNCDSKIKIRLLVENLVRKGEKIILFKQQFLRLPQCFQNYFCHTVIKTRGCVFPLNGTCEQRLGPVVDFMKKKS